MAHIGGMAGKITGAKQDPLSDLYLTAVERKTARILDDRKHPLFFLCQKLSPVGPTIQSAHCQEECAICALILGLFNLSTPTPPAKLLIAIFQCLTQYLFSIAWGVGGGGGACMCRCGQGQWRTSETDSIVSDYKANIITREAQTRVDAKSRESISGCRLAEVPWVYFRV